MIGGCTVAELQERLEFSEFSEWQEFFGHEPIGEQREDIRSASLLTLLANANRDPQKRPEPFRVEDFLPDYWQDEAERQDEMKSRALHEKMRLWAAQTNRANDGIANRDTSDQAGR